MSPLRTVYFATIVFAMSAHALFGSLPDDHQLTQGLLGHRSTVTGVLLLGALVTGLFTARLEARVATAPQGGDFALVVVGWVACLALLVATAMLSSRNATIDAGFGATQTVTLRPGLHAVVLLAIVFGAIDTVATILRLRDAKLRRAMSRDAEPPTSQPPA